MLSTRNSGELYVVGIVRVSQGVQVLYQQRLLSPVYRRQSYNLVLAIICLVFLIGSNLI